MTSRKVQKSGITSNVEWTRYYRSLSGEGMKLWQLCVKQKWRRWVSNKNPYLPIPRRKTLYINTFQDHTGKPCQIHKHSTRSKHRGYYIIQLRYVDNLNVFEEHVLVKNLTKPQLVAYIKIMKGM